MTPARARAALAILLALLLLLSVSNTPIGEFLRNFGQLFH